MPLNLRKTLTIPAWLPLMLAVLSGAVWLNFGQDALFVPSRIVSIVLAISASIAFVFIGLQRSITTNRLRRGTLLLAIAAVPMLIANGMYLSYGSSDGAAGDIGGIFVMLLGWAALTGVSLYLIDSLPVASESLPAQ